MSGKTKNTNHLSDEDKAQLAKLGLVVNDDGSVSEGKASMEQTLPSMKADRDSSNSVQHFEMGAQIAGAIDGYVVKPNNVSTKISRYNLHSKNYTLLALAKSIVNSYSSNGVVLYIPESIDNQISTDQFNLLKLEEDINGYIN